MLCSICECVCATTATGFCSTAVGWVGVTLTCGAVTGVVGAVVWFTSVSIIAIAVPTCTTSPSLYGSASFKEIT